MKQTFCLQIAGHVSIDTSEEEHAKIKHMIDCKPLQESSLGMIVCKCGKEAITDELIFELLSGSTDIKVRID